MITRIEFHRNRANLAPTSVPLAVMMVNPILVPPKGSDVILGGKCYVVEKLVYNYGCGDIRVLLLPMDEV